MTTSTLNNEELARIGDQVADMVARALDDSDHPLANDLAELQEIVERDRQGKLFKEEKKQPRRRRIDPTRYLFMPQPGISDPTRRGFWPLQLLLQIAAHSVKHATRVAQQLDLSVENMCKAAADAATVSTRVWSGVQYLNHLVSAIQFLDHPDAGMRVKNRHLMFPGGTTIKLSPSEDRMMRLLIEHQGQVVTYSTFKENGIQNPTAIKLQLCNKAKKVGVDLTITSCQHAYVLAKP